MSGVTEDMALDALATALALRIQREVRALLAAERGDDDHALGLAGLASIGYVPRTGPKAPLTATQRRSLAQHAARPKKR